MCGVVLLCLSVFIVFVFLLFLLVFVSTEKGREEELASEPRRRVALQKPICEGPPIEPLSCDSSSSAEWSHASQPASDPP